MDWLGLVVGAVLGTLVMTTLMEGGQYLRLTRMSLPFILGTFVTENRTWAKVWGFFLHFANGIVFALGYGLFFIVVGRSDWWLGAIAGFLHAAFVLTVVIPVMPESHHRLPRQDEGPDPPPLPQPPGVPAPNHGLQRPLGPGTRPGVYGAGVVPLAPP